VDCLCETIEFIGGGYFETEFLGEEVDGALLSQKIHGESIGNAGYIPSAATLHVSSNRPKLGS
jgi:hypothetical protein